MVGSALRASGPHPDQDRLMIHHIYRQHLTTLAITGYPEHYPEVIGLVLILSEAGSLDPDVWLDLVNVLAKSGGRQDDLDLTSKSRLEEWTKKSLSFAASQTFMQLDDVRIKTAFLESRYSKITSIYFTRYFLAYKS